MYLLLKCERGNPLTVVAHIPGAVEDPWQWVRDGVQIEDDRDYMLLEVKEAMIKSSSEITDKDKPEFELEGVHVNYAYDEKDNPCQITINYNWYGIKKTAMVLYCDSAANLGESEIGTWRWSVPGRDTYFSDSLMQSFTYSILNDTEFNYLTESLNKYLEATIAEVFVEYDIDNMEHTEDVLSMVSHASGEIGIPVREVWRRVYNKVPHSKKQDAFGWADSKRTSKLKGFYRNKDNWKALQTALLSFTAHVALAYTESGPYGTSGPLKLGSMIAAFKEAGRLIKYNMEICWKVDKGKEYIRVMAAPKGFKHWKLLDKHLGIDYDYVKDFYEPE
jgi:hypothetical protein